MELRDTRLPVLYILICVFVRTVKKQHHAVTSPVSVYVLFYTCITEETE